MMGPSSWGKTQGRLAEEHKLETGWDLSRPQAARAWPAWHFWWESANPGFDVASAPDARLSGASPELQGAGMGKQPCSSSSLMLLQARPWRHSTLCPGDMSLGAWSTDHLTPLGGNNTVCQPGGFSFASKLPQQYCSGMHHSPTPQRVSKETLPSSASGKTCMISLLYLARCCQ